uniref:WD repeat-containing protein 7-like n=1 Tax=Styela clava TaxID=7725 RepID=UPI001939AFFB|nr:WD repeat-containing protein 7-like [Styela clava]
MNSLIVPIVMWGGKPPTHKIRAITMTKDLKHILTGCADGQICIWDMNDTTKSIQPKMLLFGHSSSVVSIVSINNGTKDTKFMASASLTNELFLWDLSDGRCLEQTRLSGSPSRLMLTEITIDGKAESCILCVGLFAEIFILSAVTLEMVATLVSRIYPDWINCCCITNSGPEMSVVGLTMSGTIKVWQIPNNLSTKSSPILEDESKQLRCQNAVQLTHASHPDNYLLIVCPYEWQLYDSGDFSLLCTVPSPHGSVFSGGDFLKDNYSVALYDQNGIVFLYSLPTTSMLRGSRDSVKDFDKCKVRLLYSFCSKETSELSSPPVMDLFNEQNGDFILCSGNSNGSVSLWSISKNRDHISDTVNLLCNIGLQTHWESLVRKPAGIIDQLGKDLNISVTTSLYIESLGQLACGREDGSIIIVPAARACKSRLLRDGPLTKKTWLPHRTMRGHQDRVTYLLYPHQESNRYSSQIFVSGSADFTIILWELFTGVQLHVFNIHGGEITQLIVPPEECSPRVQQSICSVASDHSVAILSIRERKCVMLAASHTSTVVSIKWRPLDDFVLVACADGGLFVWQMETGHLDRYVTGVTATEIFAACDESSSNRTDDIVHGNVNLSQAFKRRNLAGFKAAAQQGLRNIIETIEDKIQDDGEKQGNLNAMSCTKAMLVQPLRASPTQDDDSHIVFFNTEAIIGTLLQEQALRKKLSRVQKRAENGNNPSSARKVLNAFIYQVKNQLLDSSDQGSSAASTPNISRKHKEKEKKSPSMEVDTIMNVAQLLLSCLHGWGLDQKLDDICKNKLGIFEPLIPICFGLLSREGQMALMLPTWTKQKEVRITKSEDIVDGCTHLTFSIIEDNVAKTDDVCSHSGHWEVSSTITTHHLISIIAVANTLMELSNLSFSNNTKTSNANGTSLTEDSTSSNISDGVSESPGEMAQIKQGWALLATMHCVLLQELLDSPLYKPPKLELLARRWQDRCLEVREAAQALLLAKLRQIEPEGRRKIVEEWARHMPDYVQQQHIDLVPNTRTEERLNSVSASGTPTDDIMDKSSVSSVELATEAPTQSLRPTAQRLSYETRRRQATAVIILGVIGAEFGQEMEPSRSNNASPSKSQSKSEIPEGFKLTNYSMARNTCKALVYLLLYPASPRLPANAPIRRAAIDLIGRGFTVWEPYVEVSAVLLGLLENCVDYSTHLASIQSGLPLSAQADSCRSSHHALCLIATARPLTFITTIAREVARHNAAAANPQHQALLATSIIVRSRAEVLRIIELLADKMMSDVMDLLVEVIDVILFCIDTNALRTANSLIEAVPALSRFHTISYDPRTRRIAVGTRRGAIYLYDLRTNKHQIIHRGRYTISTLAFSPEGKYLSVYSVQDNLLSFWMTSSTLFGMLQAQVKNVKTVRLLPSSVNQRIVSSPDHTRDNSKNFMKLSWVNNRITVLLLPDGNEYKCHV